MSKEVFEKQVSSLKYGIGASVNRDIKFDSSKKYWSNINGFDLAIGGPLLSGSMVEIHGSEATGKTLLALEYIKEAQKTDLKTAIFDYDMSFNPNFASKIGVDLSKLELINIPIAEDSLNLLYKMVESNQYGIIVIDSLPAILPRDEEFASYGNIDDTLQSKILNKFLFKVKPLLQKKENNTLLIFTNQTRMSMTGNGYRTVGGRTFRSFMDVRILLEKDSYLKLSENNDTIGIRVDCSIMKNKLYNKLLNSKIDIIFDFGVMK